MSSIASYSFIISLNADVISAAGIRFLSDRLKSVGLYCPGTTRPLRSSTVPNDT